LKAEKAIIHFGMDKTGSTSIRASLSKNLSDPRFHYVTLGIANASRGLSAGFKENPATFPYFRHSGLSDEELAKRKTEAIGQLGSELQRAAGRTAILSAEAVSNFNEQEFRHLCDTIGRHGRETAAAGYIRRPKEYMESNFQQQVRGSFLGRLLPDRLLPDYRRFEKFDAVLGRDNVRFWLFDPKSFPDGCVVRDFCARLDIRFRPEDVIRINEGLSRPALSLLFAYRKFGGGYKPGPALTRQNALLVLCLQKLAGPKLRLHSSLVAPVIAARREGIAWTEDRLGASLAEDLAAHDDDAIRSEEDLLKFSPESLHWLAGQLGPEYVQRVRPDMRPQEVAEWMQALNAQGPRKDRVGAEAKAGENEAASAPLGIDELAKQARQSVSGLENLSDEQARALLLEAFGQINRKINAASDGVVRVSGLGQFHVTPVERTVKGRKVIAKRIIFRPAKPGSDTE
jgi:hypothetical protein